MVSTADRLFAIPELLEHILLYLHDDTEALSITHPKTLFTLRRVNRGFHGTMTGSKRLQWRMETVRSLDDDAELVSERQVVTPYMQRRELQVGPYKYRDISTFLPTKSSEVQFSICADGLAHGSDNIHRTIGILGRSRFLYGSAEHSQRSIYATRIADSTIVEVYVKLGDFCKTDGKVKGKSDINYVARLFKKQEPITLGEVADMLFSIQQRTLLQHKALAYCARPGVYEDTQWNHDVAERFLNGVSMYLAWMRFEPERTLAKLKKLASDDYMSWMAYTGIELLEKKLQLNARANLCNTLIKAWTKHCKSLSNMLTVHEAQVADDGTLDVQLQALELRSQSQKQATDRTLDGLIVLIAMFGMWTVYVVASFFLFSTSTGGGCLRPDNVSQVSYFLQRSRFIYREGLGRVTPSERCDDDAATVQPRKSCGRQIPPETSADSDMSCK